MGDATFSEEVDQRRNEEVERSRKDKVQERDSIEETLFGTRPRQSFEPKEPPTEKNVEEFLKIVKQSEYKIIEQLNRTPARISLLSLIMSSEPHRAALLHILEQAHVRHDITVENLDSIVGNIVAHFVCG